MRVLLPALLAAALAVPAAAQTVDEVIARNLKARGGLERIKAVRSLRMSGTMSLGPGQDAPLTLELKRGNRMRMEFKLDGMTAVQAFDGQKGWALMPWTGRSEPQPMPDEIAREAEDQADIDGPLVDYKAKGHTVELLGKEAVDGTDAYKLKLEMKNGASRTIWIDAARHLEIRGESRLTVGGRPTLTETRLGDYRDVGGLMFPHRVEGGPVDAPVRQKIVIERIEIDPAIDDARFTMPAPASPKP